MIIKFHKIRNPQLSKENFKEKEKLVTGTDGGLTPRRTGRLTVGRKITLTLTLTLTLGGGDGPIVNKVLANIGNICVHPV
jgi:hypothetical protein